jgi:LPXTG-motif cell wall-anchored protein
VHVANCVYGATSVDVTLSALDQPDVLVGSAHEVPDANGAWTANLEIPADAVIGGPGYAVNARCSQPTTTIFPYQPSSIRVTAEAVTSSTSSSSTATSTEPTTTTESSTTTATEAIAGVVDTLAPAAIPTASPATAAAALPRTGSDDAPGLTLLALTFVGAGGLLVLSRPRSRRAG